ncbi:MAG: TlpA family protein disulfide reductase [Bacteroidales bacterium]|nr:TlpA family protein disulfide reductase [Bacteroidales bacterium]
MKIKTSILIWAAALTAGSILCMQSCTQDPEIIVPQVTFENIESLFSQKSDTVYVINFWATWCKPCFKELPEFEKLRKEYKNKAVRVVLISLDFPNKHDSELIPFIRENNLKSGILHLTDTDANKWIDKVSPLWSGAIPATIIYKKNKKEFYERSMTFDELQKIVEYKLKE